LHSGWLSPERLSGTVTFLFTDIEGSTRLLKRLGPGRYSELMADHQWPLREAFGAHRGQVIDPQGDSFSVAFRRRADAGAQDLDRPGRISQLTGPGLRPQFPPLRGAEALARPPVLRRRSLWAATLAGVIAAAVAIPVFALGGGGSGNSEALASVGADAVGAI